MPRSNYPFVSCLSNCYTVVPTCSVGDDCSSEVFQVRLLSSNHAEVKVPESFKLKGHFRCVTPEVRNPEKCSWPPLRKTCALVISFFM